jgi:hypothetical protein
VTRNAGAGRHPTQFTPAHALFSSSVADLRRNGRLFPRNYLHDSSRVYLYQDFVLEP